MQNGYISILRSRISPEWDAKTRALYVWLVSEAAFTPHPWRGVMVGRGQLLVTLRDLADIFGASYVMMRKRLQKIVAFGSIATETVKVDSSKASDRCATLITITDYNARTETVNSEINTELTPNAQKLTPNKLSSNELQTSQNSEVNIGLTAELTIHNTSIQNNAAASVCAHEGEAKKADDFRVIAARLRNVVKAGGDTARMQIEKRSGLTLTQSLALAEDFANDCACGGFHDESGMRLVQHFANWLQKRRQYREEEASRKRIQEQRERRYENATDYAERTQRECAISLYNECFPESPYHPGGGGDDRGGIDPRIDPFRDSPPRTLPGA